MSQSLSKLYVHIIFHVKDPSHTFIRKPDKNSLYNYIGSIIKDNGSIPLIINGTEDHMHIFCVMSKNIALSMFVKDIKRHSSRWLKGFDNFYRVFKWQGGYGGFSVSSSLYDKTFNYIKKQERHHETMSFKDEYLLFLKEYGIEYNEEYLWG
ncbi:transposase [Plebeiibacterium marinum]|uniref:Transposase n=1 Tax=Plebeiibacterium marinum TaxID=2992111 RepID=A0AAE3SLH5_9BACT|nr:transposase [Plebeiobacterium marinum]MCW3807890.1 transposase [Plebeiobacterium marinum]